MDEVRFVTLADGTILVDGDEEDDLARLAEALEAELKPPYRAHAVRADDQGWTVAAEAIELVELSRELEGDELELTVRDGERMLVVDGAPASATRRELERLGAERGNDFVVRATRVDGDLWDVRVLPCKRVEKPPGRPESNRYPVRMPQLGSLEKVLRFGEGRRLKRLREQADLHRHARAGLRGALRRRARRQDGRVPAADRERRAARRAALRGLRGRPRGVQAPLGQRHFDVQLMGGIVLHEGDIAEMKTGEGKTLRRDACRST